MSKSLTINAPQIVQTRNTLNAVPSGSTEEPDYSVKFVPQDLTETQQAQARQNIGAAAAGEGGGATVNEFHYLRDTTTDPATYYIDADGYEPKEGDLITIVWDWPFYTDENYPDAAFKNPAMLKNNSTNPSIYIKNAHQMTTDYDEIDPEVNTRWTVRLEKVDNTWYAYNISTAIQADWNTSDSKMPSYIKNKPTIPAAQVQSDWNQSDNAAVDYIKNKPTIPAAPVQSNWNESDTNSLAYIQNKPAIPTKEIPEDKAHMIFFYTITSDFKCLGSFEGAYSNGTWMQANNNNINNVPAGRTVTITNNIQGFEFNHTHGDLTIIVKTKGATIRGANNYPFVKVTVLYGTQNPGWWGHNPGVYLYDEPIRNISMDDYDNFYFYNLSNTWWHDVYSTPKFSGNIVMVDKPMPTSEFTPTTNKTIDTTNLKHIYVPRNRVTEFENCLSTVVYDTNTVDITGLTSKITPYDFLTWIDEYTAQIVILPTTT